jgi:cell division protein FtsL
MYNYGSEAREIEYSAEVTNDNAVKLSKRQRMEAYVNARIDKLKKKAITTLVIVAAILAVVMIREARIDQLCGQISNIEDDIYDLNAMITEREMHLSYQLDMNNIDEIAVSRLGMKKPDASQYIYIDVQKNVGGEILMKDNSAGNGFSAFVNKAKILLEYLY